MGERFLKISRSVSNRYLFTETSLKYKSKSKLDRFKWAVNDKKLDNSISRARTNVFNICMYNRFYWFFTQTISSKFCRSDYKFLVRKVAEITCNLRKLHADKQFYYVVVPEYHADKQNWHLHGFLSADYIFDSYTNNNGFLSLKHFDKLGFNSISKIRHYDKAIFYTLEYINKNVAKDIPKGQCLYFCSRGLKRSNVIEDYTLSQIAPVHYEYKNVYVFKTSRDKHDYYKFITTLDKVNNTILDYNHYKPCGVVKYKILHKTYMMCRKRGLYGIPKKSTIFKCGA